MSGIAAPSRHVTCREILITQRNVIRSPIIVSDRVKAVASYNVDLSTLDGYASDYPHDKNPR